MTKSFAAASYSMGQMNALVKLMQKQVGEDAVERSLRGEVEFAIKSHIIECDAAPFVPDGWKVEEHIRGGQFEWSADKVELYLSDEQKKGSIEGHKLRKLLKNKPVLNANVLDYLLAHPEIIPDSWKDKYIFFWGTIYRRSADSLYVRYLRWFGGEWDCSCRWLGNVFHGDLPTALLASI